MHAEAVPGLHFSTATSSARQHQPLINMPAGTDMEVVRVKLKLSGNVWIYWLCKVQLLATKQVIKAILHQARQ